MLTRRSDTQRVGPRLRPSQIPSVAAPHVGGGRRETPRLRVAPRRQCRRRRRCRDSGGRRGHRGRPCHCGGHVGSSAAAQGCRRRWGGGPPCGGAPCTRSEQLVPPGRRAHVWCCDAGGLGETDVGRDVGVTRKVALRKAMQILGNSGPTRLKLGKARPKSVKSGPASTKFLPMSTDVGPLTSGSGQNWAGIGQIQARSGQVSDSEEGEEGDSC